MQFLKLWEKERKNEGKKERKRETSPGIPSWFVTRDGVYCGTLRRKMHLEQPWQKLEGKFVQCLCSALASIRRDKQPPAPDGLHACSKPETWWVFTCHQGFMSPMRGGHVQTRQYEMQMCKQYSTYGLCSIYSHTHIHTHTHVYMYLLFLFKRNVGDTINRSKTKEQKHHRRHKYKFKIIGSFTVWLGNSFMCTFNALLITPTGILCARPGKHLCSVQSNELIVVDCSDFNAKTIRFMRQ